MKYTIDNHISSLFRKGYSREDTNKYISFMVVEDKPKSTININDKEYWINEEELEKLTLYNINIKDIKYMWYEQRPNDPLNYETHIVYQNTKE